MDAQKKKPAWVGGFVTAQDLKGLFVERRRGGVEGSTGNENCGRENETNKGEVEECDRSWASAGMAPPCAGQIKMSTDRQMVAGRTERHLRGVPHSTEV